MNKNILIISYSYLQRDPRILRQIYSLKNNYNIQTIGLTDSNVAGTTFYKSSYAPHCKNLLEKVVLGLKIWFWQSSAIRRNLMLDSVLKHNLEAPDIIIANDWTGLYVANFLKEKKNWSSKIYFDSHEYFPEYRTSWFWKLFEKPLIIFTLKKSRDSFDIMSTVCPSFARKYEKYYHFEPGTVRVITNAPEYEPGLKPRPTGEKIRIIHHGIAFPLRKLENMIDIMDYLPEDEYELYFMLVKNDKAYYEEMVRYASKHSNIHFLEPVPFREISSFINQFDIGLNLVTADNVSYKYALPNKFFEYVQGRLAIAVGDSYEMKQYIRKYDLGVAAEENTARAVAEEIRKMSREDIMRCKQNSHKHARELSAETNMMILREIAEELLGKTF